ncbi:MAG: M56 family metallopeptidase, partial [Planctomycetota bacterium]
MTRLLSSPFAHDIGMTLVHSLWQIALVAVLFAIAHRLLVRRSANLRYAAAYAALACMLALPAITLFAISATSESRPESLSGVAMESAEPNVAEPPATPTIPFPTVAPPQAPVESAEAWQMAAPRLTEPTVAEAEPNSDRRWNAILPWLAVGWSLGVIAFSLRPFLALHRCRQLRQQAQAVDAPWIIDALASLCAQVGLQRQVAIASSTLAQVPTVMGFLRPIIVLPVSMLTGQSAHELSAIIAHELAHIRRHDFLMNLIQTAIETLLFYHPAAWWLSSVVRQERENCCDDIAMAICGRKNYAAALANLEFARSAGTGLAVAADGGSLYRRIRRIARPYENPSPLGRWLAALVALTALLAGIVAVLPTDGAAVAASNEQDEESVSESNDQLEGDSAESEEDQEQLAIAARTYVGQVLDAEGQPVADARVYAENRVYDRLLKRQVLGELESTLSAADGTYSLTVKPPKGINQVIATKTGYGPAIANQTLLGELFEQGKSELNLRLVDEMAITGRVVNTEGEPLSGVVIHVNQIALPRSEEAVADWIANEQPGLFRRNDRDLIGMGNDPRITKTAFPVAAVVRHGTAIPGDVTTSADGSFRLDQLGENCRVQLTLSGPDIATRQAIVVTRQMRKVTAYAHGIRSGEFTHYGAAPTLVASPTQPIEGRVVDAATKRPLPNIPVRLTRAGKDHWIRYSDNITDATDAEGRFRLVGAPLGGQHLVEVHPPADQPYLETKRELPAASGSAPLPCDF